MSDSNSTQIREASIEDLGELAELFRQYCRFYATSPTEESCTAFIKERLVKSDSLLFVAKSEGKLAGFVQIYPSFSSVAMQKVWILNDLFVSREYRCRGIAGKLLKTVEKNGRTKNIFSIKLATEVTNHLAAKLYQSHGFKRIDNFHYYSKKL
ncbi:GNAT family N-acetyltransferase [Aliikangiella sp. G2MR2-5]|uniref:GNAT family N-acetyltransferase n=1 Tax=Aliikangiella sp. G2MR2-5 TaxID=2788943 RepID=UPI0018ABC859|nr:GNAT family N-acetyltransferase [Aliikangiella sp. G2MR2-5]